MGNLGKKLKRDKETRKRMRSRFTGTTDEQKHYLDLINYKCCDGTVFVRLFKSSDYVAADEKINYFIADLIGFNRAKKFLKISTNQ